MMPAGEPGDHLWPPLLVVAGVVAVFQKLALTKQYTFLANSDQFKHACDDPCYHALKAFHVHGDC